MDDNIIELKHNICISCYYEWTNPETGQGCTCYRLRKNHEKANDRNALLKALIELAKYEQLIKQDQLKDSSDECDPYYNKITNSLSDY